MSNYDKLPVEVQKAIEQYGHGQKLDNFLHEWRRDLEARNWLNNWVLSAQDQLFVEFHNQYQRDRNLI
jgi:hypothetical protein